MGTFHGWSKQPVSRCANEVVFGANTKGLPAASAQGIDRGIIAVRAHVAGTTSRHLTDI